MVHRIKGELCANKQGPDSRGEEDRQSLWLIKVLYAIKRDLLGFVDPRNVAFRKARALINR